MTHGLSTDDRCFLTEFEACRWPLAQFDHRAHLRLAYIYLAENDDETAHARMRSALRAFIEHHHVPTAKFHETMTRAWILAVRHFMARSSSMPSAAAFIDANPIMLDSTIMTKHYSAQRLFSPEARAQFVEPDLRPIPRHRG